MYFEQAASAGIIEAAYNLGLILENGLLSSPNPREALMWYKKAADAGSPEAKTAMDHLAKAMNISQADIDELYKTSKAAASAQQQTKPQPEKSSVVKKPAPVREARADMTQAQRQAIPLSDAAPASPPADMAVVAQIQEQLVRLGLYPGPADGIMGPQTEDAIRAYQKMHELPRDGRPTQALLVNLLSADLAEPPQGDTRFQ
jgi:TPR repeat protein